MAITENTYTGDGVTVLFSFTFPYLVESDIKVSLDGTLTTAYTLANATTIQFNTAPGNGVAIRIYRDTNVDNLSSTFFPGSAIKAEDLNNNFTQNNYSAQESKAAAGQAPTALANSVTALATANQASADASAALNAVNQVVSAQTVSNVAALAVLDTSGLSVQDLAAVFNSTNIETYNTTYPSAPQITGVPVGFVGASDVTVRLAWNGTGWVWNGYFSTDPDNRYLAPTDIGVTVQAYDANALSSSDIGVTVQAYDADTAKLDTAQSFTALQTFDSGIANDGPYTEDEIAVAALDVDCSLGNYFTKTIAANSTFTFSNAPASGRAYAFTLEVTHTSGTITWPASVKWPSDIAPTLTTGKTHLFMFVTKDGGTRWRGAVLFNYVD